MDRRQQKTKIAIHQAMTTLLKKKKFEALTVQDIIDEANIGRRGFANRLTHILYHLQDHKENIKAIMYGETEKLFTSYFRSKK